MRRGIGPPYERSPAERVGRWIVDHFILLVAACIIAVVYCFIVDVTVGKFFNFLDTGGHDELQGRFSTVDPRVTAVKAVGSIALIWFICRIRAK